MYTDQANLNNLIIEEINRRNGPIDILFLFNYESTLLEETIQKTNAKITLVSSDQNFNSERLDKWAEDPFKFIDLSIETKTRFDLVLLVNPEKYFEGKETETFSFKELHKEMFRNIQKNLLKDTGLIILETHKEGFVLDEYIRPGADKLTKKVLTEEERQQSNLQAYAFYA